MWVCSSEIPLTPFAESCFLILDIEANKRLHFRDFIVALWQFLTLDAPNLIEFAFDVFEAHIGALNIGTAPVTDSLETRKVPQPNVILLQKGIVALVLV